MHRHLVRNIENEHFYFLCGDCFGVFFSSQIEHIVLYKFIQTRNFLGRFGGAGGCAVGGEVEHKQLCKLSDVASPLRVKG